MLLSLPLGPFCPSWPARFSTFLRRFSGFHSWQCKAYYDNRNMVLLVLQRCTRGVRAFGWIFWQSASASWLYASFHRVVDVVSLDSAKKRYALSCSFAKFSKNQPFWSTRSGTASFMPSRLLYTILMLPIVWTVRRLSVWVSLASFEHLTSHVSTVWSLPLLSFVILLYLTGHVSHWNLHGSPIQWVSRWSPKI